MVKTIDLKRAKISENYIILFKKLEKEFAKLIDQNRQKKINKYENN